MWGKLPFYHGMRSPIPILHLIDVWTVTGVYSSAIGQYFFLSTNGNQVFVFWVCYIYLIIYLIVFYLFKFFFPCMAKC